MKNTLLFLSLTISSSVFAGQTIQLPAGGSATINAGETTQVSCASSGGGPSTGKCKIEAAGTNGDFFLVMDARGNTHLFNPDELKQANDFMKQLAIAGLCK